MTDRVVLIFVFVHDATCLPHLGGEATQRPQSLNLNLSLSGPKFRMSETLASINVIERLGVKEGDMLPLHYKLKSH